MRNHTEQLNYLNNFMDSLLDDMVITETGTYIFIKQVVNKLVTEFKFDPAIAEELVSSMSISFPVDVYAQNEPEMLTLADKMATVISRIQSAAANDFTDPTIFTKNIVGQMSISVEAFDY